MKRIEFEVAGKRYPYDVPENWDELTQEQFIIFAGGIVDSYDLVGDFGEMDLKWSGCERVAEQIIGRMMTDKVKPFQRIEAESITGEYMANTAQKYVGYRVTLTLTDCSICMFDKNAWLNPSLIP